MQKEIGSNFDLNPATVSTNENDSFELEIDFKIFLERLGLKGSDSVFLSSARGAQNLVLDTIEERNPAIRKVALIPPFTCFTVIDPFLKHGYQLLAYPTDEALNVDLEKFRELLIETEAQVVLVHPYFGFNTLKGFEEIITEFSSQGTIFIEDRTQCLYSDFEPLAADFIIASLRKWAGLPDGGVAVCQISSFNYKPSVYDKELEDLKLKAAYAKYDYLHQNAGDKEKFLQLFQKGEAALNSQNTYFKISPASVAVQNSLDLSLLKKKRRENYLTLYEGLKASKALKILMPELSNAEVPLYFALVLEERDKLQNLLRQHDIYAPVIWPKPAECPPISQEVEAVYDSILCIPIDQRYDQDDMMRILSVMKEWR